MRNQRKLHGIHAPRMMMTYHETELWERDL